MPTQQSTDTAPLENSPPLQGERVAFTGTLASMTHEQARSLVAEHGGTAVNGIARQTTMLVVGEEGWPLESNGRMSEKLRHANNLNDSGATIRIVGESDWLALIGLSERRDEVRRQYTPAMLSSLLEIPVRVIRRWERLGLIRAVRRVHRLPYFDYEEVRSARRLSELLDEGVSSAELESSLSNLDGVVAGVERSVAQLHLLVRDSRVVAQDQHGLLRPSTGQRLFDFESSHGPVEVEHSTLSLQSTLDQHDSNRQIESSHLHRTSADWFEEGCRLADADRLEDAVEAYRLALTAADGVASRGLRERERTSRPLAEQTGADKPHPAEVNFHLADALYRLSWRDAAIERYYCAVELDPQYLEAWTQLGCLLAESAADDAAIDAFRIALDLHPTYPEAHWHLGNLLANLDRNEEAAGHWSAFLESEAHGPWANAARQRLLEQTRPADPC